MENLTRIRVEHQLVTRFVTIVRAGGDSADGIFMLEKRAARLAVKFLSNFVVEHLEREESDLFRALERRGLPGHIGPLGALRSQHLDIRRRIARLGRLLERWRGRARGSVLSFGDELTSLAKQLQDHEGMEEHIIEMQQRESGSHATTPARWVTLLDELERQLKPEVIPRYSPMA